MKKLIYIVGAGGHAKVLLESLQQNSKLEVAGLLEINTDLIGGFILNTPIYFQDTMLEKYSPQDVLLVHGIGSINIPNLRAMQFNQFKALGYCFNQVIHQTAYYSSDVKLNEGVQLLARSTILTGTKIGCNTIVNTSASIDHDCIIGEHVHIAPGAVLSGAVHIENGCHVGTGAVIIEGVHIGENSLIAAGAVVTKSFPKNSRIAGVPAKNI